MGKNYLLKITYSWGDEEPEMRFDSFENAWDEAKRLALNEVQTYCTEDQPGEDASIYIISSSILQEGVISLLYTDDHSECRYTVCPEETDCSRYERYYSYAERAKHLKFWSDGFGYLYDGHVGIAFDELPEPLKKPYRELLNEEAKCPEYLTEYDGGYYIAVGEDYSEDRRGKSKCLQAIFNARELLQKPNMNKCQFLYCDASMSENRYTLYFLIPVDVTKIEFETIEEAAVAALWYK